MQSHAKVRRARGDLATAASDVFERKQPELETEDTTITVLSVSPIQHDHDALDCVLCRPKWKLHKAPSLSSAMLLLQETLRWSWQDMNTRTTGTSKRQANVSLAARLGGGGANANTASTNGTDGVHAELEQTDDPGECNPV
jgi:hypothetical protein